MRTTRLTILVLLSFLGIHASALHAGSMTAVIQKASVDVHGAPDFSAPAVASPSANATIPGRVLYGDSELNANPNTPSVADQNTRNGGRNPNDPSACTP